jgi:MFS family permease
MNALRSLFLSIGGAAGVVYPFIAVILVGRGFDVVGVGVVTALSAVAFTAAVPVWGHVADVLLGRPRTLQVSAIGAGIALGLTLLPVPPLIVALCFIAFSASESAFAPLSDALAVNGVPDARRDYARVRLMSSLAFAVSTIVGGFVYDQTGFAPMPILFALAAVVVVASAALVPDVERADLRALAADADAAAAERTTTASRAGGKAPAAEASRGTTSRFGSVSVALVMAPRLPLALLAIGLIHAFRSSERNRRRSPSRRASRPSPRSRPSCSWAGWHSASASASCSSARRSSTRPASPRGWSSTRPS